MLPESLAPCSESIPPTSARVSIAPRSEIRSSVQGAGTTDVGQVRKLNEDCFRIERGLGLYVVCDGMGGHAAGDVASQMAIQVFCEAVAEREALVRSYVGGEHGLGASKREIVELLRHAVACASAAVHAEANRDTAKRGMGTTLVALLLLGNHAFVTHVGDSRAYLLRSGRLEQLTRDHNVFNDLVLRKKLSLEQARTAAPKSAITRAIGVYEHCEPDTMVLDVASGDRLLLCSDGLSGYFEEQAGCVAMAASMSAQSGEQVVNALVAAANARGGKDNITAVVATLGSVGEHDLQELTRLQSGRDALSQSRVFELLDERELLHVLGVTEVVKYRAEQVVVEVGERGDEMFIVLSGEVEVYRGDFCIAKMGPGEHFGEMALLRDRPRSAQAIAVADSELLVIPTALIYESLRSQSELGTKLLWCLSSVLADRLAQTTRELSESRDAQCAEDLSDSVFYGEDDSEEDEEDRRITLRPPAAVGS